MPLFLLFLLPIAWSSSALSQIILPPIYTPLDQPNPTYTALFTRTGGAAYGDITNTFIEGTGVFALASNLATSPLPGSGYTGSFTWRAQITGTLTVNPTPDTTQLTIQPNPAGAFGDWSFDFRGLENGLLPTNSGSIFGDYDANNNNNFVSNFGATASGGGAITNEFFSQWFYDGDGPGSPGPQVDPIYPSQYPIVTFDSLTGLYTIRNQGGATAAPNLALVSGIGIETISYRWRPELSNQINLYGSFDLSGVIPEPSTGLLGALASLLVLRRRRVKS